jgi:hypothetical protein
LDEIDLKSSTSKIRSRLRAPNPTMIPIFFLKIKVLGLMVRVRMVV